MIIHRFDSVDAYVTEARRIGANERRAFHDQAWDLGVTAEVAATLAVAGDPDLTPAIVTGLDSIEVNAREETCASWKRDVWGSRPDIGGYLSGSPYSMVRRAKAARSTRHIDIYVSLACLATINANQLLARGRTILALLETLQQMQVATDLYLLCEKRATRDPEGHYQIIRVESRPLDLSSAGFAIAHPAFVRNLVYEYCQRTHGDSQHPPTQYFYPGTRTPAPDYQEWAREKLEIPTDAIWIPRAEPNDLSVTNPAAFIRQMIEGVS